MNQIRSTINKIQPNTSNAHKSVTKENQKIENKVKLINKNEFSYIC